MVVVKNGGDGDGSGGGDDNDDKAIEFWIYFVGGELGVAARVVVVK